MEGVIDLHKACRIGLLSAVEQAINAQPDHLNHRDPGLGWTPLYRAVVCEHVQVIQFLLERGANPNLPNHLGETPLHFAVDNNLEIIVEILLKYHANPNQVNNENNAPIHIAIGFGNHKIIDLLVQYQADPNLRSGDNERTPLHLSAIQKDEKTCKYLLRFGGNPLLEDLLGNTPVIYGHPELDDLFNQNNTLSVSNSYALSHYDNDLDISSSFSELTENVMQNSSLITPSDGASRVVKLQQMLDSDSSDEDDYGNKLPLYDWLRQIGLEQLYKGLLEDGYDDIQAMIEQMTSPMPITMADLAQIGIKKPGHRARLLYRLEEAAGLLQTPIAQPQQKHRLITCCTTPSNSTSRIGHAGNLRDWLYSIGLEDLYDKFQEAGYDDFDSLVGMMNWKYPINDQMLMGVGINKLGHRTRILSKLQEEVLRKAEPFVIENTGKSTACGLCFIM